MANHQRGELNSSKIWSRITSAFTGSRSKDTERIWTEIKELWTALDHLHEVTMANFSRLDSAIDGVIADNAQLKNTVVELHTEIDGLKAALADADAKTQAEIDARAAKIENVRGGSTGGVV